MKSKAWNIIGAIAAIIAVGITIVFFAITQRRQSKKIEIICLSKSNLLNPELSKPGGKFQIIYDGKPIEDIVVFRIKIQNSGGQPVTINDYTRAVKIFPMNFKEIIKADIVMSSPPDLSANAEISEGYIQLDNILMNPGDEYILEMGVIPQGIKIPDIKKVTARIKGIKNIEFKEVAEVSERPTSYFYITFIVMQMIMTITMVFYVLTIIRRRRIEIVKKVRKEMMRRKKDY